MSVDPLESYTYSTMRRLVLLSCVVLALLAGGLSLLLKSYTAAFPDLEPGIYLGTLAPSKTAPPIPWIVVRFAGEQSLAVGIGSVRLPAQRIAPVDPSGRNRLPLVVGDNEARLRMTGSLKEVGRYEGEYLNPISQESGRWQLRKLASDSQSPVVEQELTRWYSIWQELEHIEQEIQDSQKKADEQRSSIENLHRYVSNGETLRKTADVRLGKMDSELDVARSELQQRQQQLDKVIRDFDLSQRISPAGRLIFLSRETIQRESRWIELSLELLAPETSLGFDQALQRAEKIRSLKRDIAKEREATVERATQERYPGQKSETRSEEEFYGQLQ